MAHGASVTVATDIRGKSSRTVEPSIFTGCGLGATRSGASKLLKAFQSASWRSTAVALFAVAPRSAHCISKSWSVKGLTKLNRTTPSLVEAEAEKSNEDLSLSDVAASLSTFTAVLPRCPLNDANA